ncbi:putative syntaxin binding protein [Trypanosoma cruzi]|nr:putative syntaxin binding protein [Trypanosoma cruzi]
MSRHVGIVWGGLEAAVIGGEDVYWCSYRHCFLAQCVEELSVALKKLHAYHPGLAQGVEPKANPAELSSAVRAPPEFRERQARLSLHIDFLREACGTVLGEATGGGAGGGTRHRRWAPTPQEKPGWRAAPDEGYRNAPACVTVSSVACDCEQHRRVDGGQEAAADPRRWTDVRRPFVCEPWACDEEGRERATIQHGVGAERTQHECLCEQRRNGRDTFLKHACMMMGTGRNRTLRVGLSLALAQRDHVIGPNGASGGQNSGA